MALLLSAGMILQAIEAFYLPPLVIPGAKLGLANSMTLIMIVLFGWRDVLVHVGLRVTAVAFISGTFLSTTFIYSLGAGLMSAVVMIVWHRLFYGPLSYAGVSLVGAVTHNLTQLGLAVLILGHVGILTMMPWLIIIGVATGVGNGILVNLVGPRLKELA